MCWTLLLDLGICNPRELRLYGDIDQRTVAIHMFEVESAVAPSSSGAAALDEFGSVIGIVVAGTENLVSDAGEYFGYVVPIEYCIELLKRTRGRKNTDSIFMY
ncbi:hypothetical protein RHMOL_Rhmol05G0050000 [Rhododendron molle]|uniref:Uncharacterized protein n=1 Tax=Rhododendron molle TaxID=49168 RepID=A0ACC0NLK3_RHOML|nr:hypothetical protein RHMOL_Rhmol05G0050000 [Rhododendron molle]